MERRQLPQSAAESNTLNSVILVRQIVCESGHYPRFFVMGTRVAATIHQGVTAPSNWQHPAPAFGDSLPTTM
jgi:hypothetical protein